jgi:hypothetical protein
MNALHNRFPICFQTFLKRYGMGAVGFTMLITVVGLQWGILTEVSSEMCKFSAFTCDCAFRDSSSNGMRTNGATFM